MSDCAYFSVPGDEINPLAPVLRMVGGRFVHGDQEFDDLAPPLPVAMPDSSPIRTYGGYQQPKMQHAYRATCLMHRHDRAPASGAPVRSEDLRSFWGALGCSCFAF